MFGNSIFCKYAAIETFALIVTLTATFAIAIVLF
jgi:hypothetical protein